MKKKSRANISGHLMAKAISEMINLMYQNEIAIKYLKGLVDELQIDLKFRLEKVKGGNHG